MIDEKLLNSLNSKEKEAFKKGLKDLIDQTYVIEKEYKQLNNSYIYLQNFLKQIVESLPNAIWVYDEDGKIFLQNSEANKIKKLTDLLNIEKNNYEIEFNNSFYLIKINKAYEKTIISATDITEEKRKDRLISMGQIAAHLSHEIRNPIGSVSLLASTLFKKVDTKTKPLVLQMRKSIWRVERIIKATLLFTKGLQLNKSTFYIDELSDELEASCAYYTYSKDIEFIYDFPHSKMEADFDLFSMVLQNFLFNAIDATEDDEKEKGTVNFKYDQNETYHIFTVKDSGAEIENKNILYEPFKTTKTKGHGLGLALSMEIVEAHGGKIELLQNEKGFNIFIRKIAC